MNPVNVPINHFDRGKPFYPLVMNYLLQLLGFKEIASRGLVGPRNTSDILQRLLADKTVGDPDQVTQLTKQLEKLLGPLQLRSEYQDASIMVDSDEIATDLISNFQYILTFSLRSAGSLLILAHEISKDRDYHDNTHPLWEFLRHCRNAAAHGGHFNLKKYDEPRRLAKWGPFEIIQDLEGTALFKDQHGTGLLSPGDPIRLLWDIEQAFPVMQAEG